MNWWAVTSILATIAIGIWIAKSDRDDSMRRPAIIVLGLLSMFAIGALLWDSPMSGQHRPLPESVAVKKSSARSSPIFFELMLALVVAAALAFWHSDQPLLRTLRWLVLSTLAAGAVIFGVVAKFFVLWGNKGSAGSPDGATMWLCVLLFVVCAVGIFRNPPP